MWQQGQVFKLKAKGPDGQQLWAYRYRNEGRGSERPQVGGFATRAEAEKALRKVLDRLGPGGGRATITLAEPRAFGKRIGFSDAGSRSSASSAFAWRGTARILRRVFVCFSRPFA